MTTEEIVVCNRIDTFIKENRSFAIWRIPGEKPQFVMQTAGETRFFYDIADLDGQNGFVIAPFHVNEKHPIVLIRPDLREIPSATDLTSLGSNINSDGKEMKQRCLSENQTDYRHHFQLFIEPLHRKEFDKLVLSRHEIEERPAGFSPAAAFFQAMKRYVYSYVYLCHTPITGTWLGSTPEIILSGEQGAWHTVALAGTQPIQNGILPTSWDRKNQEEQEYVALYIRKQLRALGIQPEESEPKTVRAGELTHLRSDFTFPLPDNKKLGDVLKQLHPTPAVCGLPKEKAYRFILENEGHDRMYYSGFIGWMEPEKKSDLYVNLRCMNILPEQLVLYAGGGILPSSEPESEWQETEAKMQTMKRLLKI